MISRDAVDNIRRLKQRDGGPIVVAGSRMVVHTLMEHDLVDEYRIMIFPVLLGSGKRLFPETQAKTALRLVDSRSFSSGVVVHTYHPSSKVEPGWTEERLEREIGSVRR